MPPHNGMPPAVPVWEIVTGVLRLIFFASAVGFTLGCYVGYLYL